MDYLGSEGVEQGGGGFRIAYAVPSRRDANDRP